MIAVIFFITNSKLNYKLLYFVNIYFCNHYAIILNSKLSLENN